MGDRQAWPHDEQAELNAVATAMLFPEKALECGLKPSDFYNERLGQIWAVITDLAISGIGGLTEEALVPELVRRGILPESEALQALYDLDLGSVADVPTFERSVRLVKETAERRRWLVLAGEVARIAHQGGENWVDKITKRFNALHSETLRASCASTGLDVIRDYFGSVSWAWPGWVPKGHVTLIAGDQGVGKSFLAARLMASMVGVLPWPDNASVNGSGTILLVETEEFRGEYAQRLLRFGVPDDGVILPGSEPTYLPNIIEDAAMIYGLAQRYQCTGIVVDSLSGGHMLDENSAEMRKALRVLTGLAAGLQIPVLAVHHPRKRSQFEASKLTLERIRGSSTITQFCRSVVGLWQPEEGPGKPVRVESLKNSFAPPAKPFGFTINDGGLEFGEAPEERREPTAVDRAIEFLRVELREKPKRFGELLEMAEAEGISKNSLYRAKEALRIVTVKGQWSLPIIEVGV